MSVTLNGVRVLGERGRVKNSSLTWQAGAMHTSYVCLLSLTGRTRPY